MQNPSIFISNSSLSKQKLQAHEKNGYLDRVVHEPTEMLDPSVCRTCTKTGAPQGNLFQPLKLQGDRSVDLAAVLMECTDAKIIKADGLPENVCDDCVKLLMLCYTFRNQVLRAEQKLKILTLQDTSIKEEKHEFKYENGFDETEDTYDDFGGETVPKVETAESLDLSYKCEACNKSFTHHKSYLKHVSNHGTQRVLCPICNKAFCRQSSLDKHILKHERNNCTICGSSFDTETLLLEHVSSHMDIEFKVENYSENQFVCQECGAAFAKQRSLAMHKKKHKNKFKNNIFICDVCQKEFRSKPLLKRHLKLHSEDLQYQCTKCPKKYSRQDQLKEHLDRHSRIKTNVCPHCDKAFFQLCSLKDHLRTHTRETPYLCSTCGKGFANGSNLRQHLLRHTGQRLYPCSLCPKTFFSKGEMKSHEITHSGVHPYTCEACGAAFTKPNSLKKHSLIHLAVRPFACDTCPMRFTCKDHLKRHHRVHTGEKPYKCDKCERAFTQSNDLVKHLRHHLGVNLYRCKVCDMKFRLLSELKQHYPSHYAGADDAPSDPPAGLKPAPRGAQAGALAAGLDGRVTITINNNNTNGLAGDITINILPEKS